MSNLLVFIYFICFAVIAGGAFALMWGNIRSISEDMNKPLRYNKHPEAPETGEEVMYVDLNRERLEKLYDDD